MNTSNLCGKQVPRVGLGCMGMSEFYGQSDDAESLKLLHQAFELGYRHFDTADMYGRGHNEELLSRFLGELSSEQRDEIVLATKVGIVRDPVERYSISFNNSPEYIRSACEQSLKRLGIDCIDLYYLHRLAPEQDIEAVMGTFSELIDEGKIRTVGLCEVSADVLRKANAAQRISAVQSEYSLWTRDVEDTVLPACEELDIALVGFSPLGRGILTGGVTQQTMSSANEDDDLRTRLPRFNGDNLEANIKLVEQFDYIAQTEHIAKSQLALAWLLYQSPNVHVIPGTRRFKYLRDNFQALSVDVPDYISLDIAQLFVPSAVHGERYPGAIRPNSE